MTDPGWPKNQSRTGESETVNRLARDMWYGDARNPGMTERMALVETWQKDISGNLRWMTRLIVGTFVTGIVSIIVEIVIHYH